MVTALMEQELAEEATEDEVVEEVLEHKLVEEVAQGEVGVM